MAEQEHKTQVVTGPVRQASSAGGKVVVGCKLPHGLRIQAFKMVQEREQTPMGSREIQVARPSGLPVLVHGVATPFGMIPRFRIAHGYALTEGVDLETWENWYEANMESAMVENHLVFAEPSVDRAASRAREYAKARSGLEPFAMSDDPRAPRNLRPELDPVIQEEGNAERVMAA